MLKRMLQNNLKNSKIGEIKANPSKRKSLLVLTLVGFIVAGLVIGVYLWKANERIYVEKSYIKASKIVLASATGGILNQLLVHSGDRVVQNQIIAQVGNNLVRAKKSGIIINTQDKLGEYFTPGMAVASMIIPDDLRVYAQVEEDKGLKEIKIGQPVIFTVDAFGSQKFVGIVDEISSTARTTDVVFNISDKRENKEYNVKIRFNTTQYSEIKNGMSAKVWIYRK